MKQYTKPIVIHITPSRKETPEDRKERIRNDRNLHLIVTPKKGKGSYNRRKFKRGED